MACRLPSFNQLYALAVLAETGSVSATAARLNVTPPAISRHLRELEAGLGVALLRRGPNSVALTDVGATYAAEIARGFALITAATEKLRRGSPPPIRIRAYTTWAMRWLIPRLPEFRAQHPHLTVEVLTSNNTQIDFLAEGIDAAIRSGPADTAPAPGALPLQMVEIAPYAAPGVARTARGQVLPSGVSLLGSRIRPRDWEIWAAAQGIVLPSPPVLFASTLLAIQAAIEGLGVVIAPPAFVTEDLRRCRLKRLSRSSVPTGDRYWLLLPPKPRPEVAEAFVSWLIAAAAT